MYDDTDWIEYEGTLPTAEQMANLSITRAQEIAEGRQRQKQFEHVIQLILEAFRTYVRVPPRIDEDDKAGFITVRVSRTYRAGVLADVQEKIKALGYQVKYERHFSEIVFTISWRNAIEDRRREQACRKE